MEIHATTRIAGVGRAQRLGLRSAVAAERAVGIVDIATVLVVHGDQTAISVMLSAVAEDLGLESFVR